MRAERGFNLPSIPPQWQLLLSLDELHLFVFPCVSPALHRLLLLLQSPPFSLRDPQSRGFSDPFEESLWCWARCSRSTARLLLLASSLSFPAIQTLAFKVKSSPLAVWGLNYLLKIRHQFGITEKGLQLRKESFFFSHLYILVELKRTWHYAYKFLYDINNSVIGCGNG